MRTLMIVLLILAFSAGYAQEAPNDETKKTIPFSQITPERKFENDVRKSSITIYTLGGLKPYGQKAIEAFQQKYSVKYHDFGCLAPGNMSYYEKYNLLVFNYLKDKWGEEWEKDVKDTAMGFYNWTQGR